MYAYAPCIYRYMCWSTHLSYTCILMLVFLPGLSDIFPAHSPENPGLERTASSHLTQPHNWQARSTYVIIFIAVYMYTSITLTLSMHMQCVLSTLSVCLSACLSDDLFLRHSKLTNQ